MHQRLLLILSVLFFSGAAFGQNLMLSSDSIYQYRVGGDAKHNPVPDPQGRLQKWVYDTTQRPGYVSNKFDQSNFKCYMLGGMAYRLRFPQNYDSTNPSKYPLIVFLHGAGEAADAYYAASPNNTNGTVDRENQSQLLWGAAKFEQRIQTGEFNGFLLFPQLFWLSSEWNNAHFPQVNNIIDSLVKYNGVDPDRVISMGLSAGGLGSIGYASQYPERIATAIVANPENNIKFAYNSNLTNIPIWMANGGIDDNPDPYSAFNFRENFGAGGGDLYQHYYPLQPHGSWNYQWDKKDTYGRYILSQYWNAASKAQPVVYFQKTSYCLGDAVNTTLGLSKFSASAIYEWQRDAGSGFVDVAMSSSNTYLAQQTGTYRVRFKRTSASEWSAWTPKPVVISATKCSLDTAFVEHFNNAFINQYSALSAKPGTFQSSPYTYGNYTCQNGVFVNGTENFTQDAAGMQGGRFMLNSTNVDTANCKYFPGDQIWRNFNAVSVTPNTSYTLNFYIGNNSNPDEGKPTTKTPLAQIVAKMIGGTGVDTTILNARPVSAVNAGNSSWKKYSYNWNSGSNTSAYIAITNNTTDGSGNDFVLDEISLVKSRNQPLPGSALRNVTLWSKASSINGPDGGLVALWNNDDINGDNLQQTDADLQPLFRNNAADNINFNPVVNFLRGNNSSSTNNGSSKTLVSPSFTDSTAHTAAHAYLVTKITDINQTTTTRKLFYEAEASGSGLEAALGANGTVQFIAGDNTNNKLVSYSSTIEANKPVLLSFSKDNVNNTASGHKQEIRKNGIVVASTNNTGSFTGNNSPFQITAKPTGSDGYLDGNIAEIVYIQDSVLTPAAENKIESYLALKYGTSLGKPDTAINYTASNGTVIWPGVANSVFQHDIFGIGTDSASGLVQKMSNSVNTGGGNGAGQYGKGNIVVSTGAELNDKQFLLIGNSGASLNSQIINMPLNLQLNNSSRVGRNWRVSNTGLGTGAVDLSFDTTGLGIANKSDLKRFALLISPTGDTTYASGFVTIMPTSAADNKLIFPGVTKLSDNAVFTFVTNIANVALPAVWLGFTAEAVNSNGLLKWKTSDEINVSTYTVEHSYNGVSFTSITSVPANNGSGENNYSFTHTDLPAGLHYYRIRRTDKDGMLGYSDIKSLKIPTGAASVQVRPNPVVGSTLVLAVTASQSNKSNIAVMGVDGKIIVQENVNLATGGNLLNINISTVPPGVYLVRVQLTDDVITKKFIKER